MKRNEYKNSKSRLVNGNKVNKMELVTRGPRRQAKVTVITNTEPPTASSVSIKRTVRNKTVLRNALIGSGAEISVNFLSRGSIGKIDLITATAIGFTTYGLALKMDFSYDESIVLAALGEILIRKESMSKTRVIKHIRLKFQLYGNVIPNGDYEILRILRQLEAQGVVSISKNVITLNEDIVLKAIK